MSASGPSRRAFGTALAATTLVGPGLGRAGAQPGPKRGGTLIMAAEGEPVILAPHLSNDTATSMIVSMIFSPLVSLNADLQPEPELARSWTVSPDGLSYKFELDPAARWHDGRPVTADDAEYTFNEIIGKLHPRASSWWPNVASAKATGPHSFEMTLKEPSPAFITILASAFSNGTFVMPRHVYAGTDPKTNPMNRTPVGSGPFRFVEWRRGEHVELARAPAYHKPGRPYLDRVVAQILPDSAARFLAFERGEVDFLHWYLVPPDQIARARKDKRFSVVDRGDAAATNGLLLINHRSPQFRSAAARQALAYAINRQFVRDRALFGEGKVARSHLGSSMGWAFTGEFDYPFDPARANALLDEAGLPRKTDGRRFATRIYWASGREFEGRAAEIIKDNLREIGIDATVQLFDRSAFIDRVYRQWDFDLALQLFTTGPDPVVGITPRYHSKQILKAPFVNAMGYANSEVDALLDAEAKEMNPARRTAMWRDIQRHLMRDLPALPLYELPSVHLVSARFRDVVTGPNGHAETRDLAYETA